MRFALIGAVLPALLVAACGGEDEAPAPPVLNVEARLEQGTIVDAAPRLFSAPELDSLERIGAVPDSLAVTPDTIIVTAGEAVPLSRIGVDARTRAGDRIPSLPILLTLDADIAAIEADSLRGVRAGETTLWVRSLVGRREDDPGRSVTLIVR